MEPNEAALDAGAAQKAEAEQAGGAAGPGLDDAAVEDGVTRPEAAASGDAPEVIIGIVGAVGSDLKTVAELLQAAFRSEAAYRADIIRLSDHLQEIVGLGPFSADPTEDVRYDETMKAGTQLRQTLGQPDAMARLALMVIREMRERLLAQQPSERRRAYILRSLKRREEIELLRTIYGPAFVLVGVYTPRERRVQNLATRIAQSYTEFNELAFREKSEGLISRDDEEREEKFGQNVRKAFPEADIFIDASDPAEMREAIFRFVRLLFGFPYHTPTKAEHAMFHARAASLRSSALGRQVGSAVVNDDGDVIAVGTNEAPKAFGGLYWEGDKPDGRDFVFSHDVSDRQKQDVLRDALIRLCNDGWLAAPYDAMTPTQLVRAALGRPDAPAGTKAALKGARAMDAIEFMRPVHAEMAALMDAARRGAAVGGQVMYVTTFPCHECARHLIAVGLKQVVYIDPYPKSLAAALYADSIEVEGEGTISHGVRRVPFKPFVGVSPRRFFDLFEMRGERKTGEGATIDWGPASAVLRVASDINFYHVKERDVVHEFIGSLETHDMSFI